MSSSIEPKGAPSRRQILRLTGGAALAVPASGLLGACALGGGDKSPETAATGAVTAANPFGVGKGGSLDVVVFKGGYSDTYATQVHQPLLVKAFPEVKIKHTGTQKVAEAVQPRFVGGNPPDVTSQGDLDLGALLQSGQLLDLTPLLDAPSVDDPAKKVRDTLVPGTIEAGTSDGKFHQLFYSQMVTGIWYDSALFAKKGWSVPTTWADFVALSEEIKKAGLDPFGIGGKNAADYATVAILASIGKIGGPDVLRNIDNLEDGAWQVDAVKQSLEAWAEYGAKFVDKRYEGLMHTEAQLRHVQGKLAFYPSGNFLENEMKKDTPPGFTFAMMPVPSVTTSDKLPASAVRASPGEPFIIPSKAQNAPASLEYLRQMVSRAGASGFTKLTGTLTSVQGASAGIELPPGAKSSAEALSAASDVINFKILAWYPQIKTELQTVTNSLLFGKASAEQVAKRLQGKADAVKKDASIKKFKR